MSDRKPALSKKSPYYIPKDRYYELKHFCLQYSEWKRELNEMTYESTIQFPQLPDPMDISRPTETKAMKLAALHDKCLLIESCVNLTDDLLAPWIFEGVCKDRTYDYLKTMLDIPCSRSTYYDRYRKFFWILDKYRN